MSESPMNDWPRLSPDFLARLESKHRSRTHETELDAGRVCPREVSIEAVRNSARDIVSRIPAPAPGADPTHYATWEREMMEAAEGLAAEFGDDHGRLLADAVGPPVEVGTVPAWHVLLQIALLYAEADRPISLAPRSASAHALRASSART